jgi:hypothetical protein
LVSVLPIRFVYWNLFFSWKNSRFQMVALNYFIIVLEQELQMLS